MRKKKWDRNKLLNLQNILDQYSTDKIRRTEYLFWDAPKFCLFLRLAAEKIMQNFGATQTNIFVPFYFVKAFERFLKQNMYFYKLLLRFLRSNTLEQLKCKKMECKIGYAIWELCKLCKKS